MPLTTVPLPDKDIRWAEQLTRSRCRRHGIPAFDADDVVQEVLLAVMRAWPRWCALDAPAEGFRDYVSTRVLGAAFDAVRSALGRPGSARREATHLEIERFV